jgi:hypothetical protein
MNHRIHNCSHLAIIFKFGTANLFSYRRAHDPKLLGLKSAESVLEPGHSNGGLQAEETVNFYESKQLRTDGEQTTVSAA